MNNQQAVVDQIIQNFAFDVEAVPENELIQTTSMSQSTPLNVKIKVRKKEEIHMQNNVPSLADNTSRTAQKVRLVNSDRTIMTFDVFMEAEFKKKPSRKLRKHIFDILRPGICLGAVDDDECPYMPSASYSANIIKPSVATKSDGTLKQTFTLSKNVYQDYSISTQPGGQKWLFGTCKPGGCLDPPFGEDKYSYKPSTRSGPEREGEELLEAKDVESDAYENKKPLTLHDEESQSNGRQSSIFDSGLFKKKRKSSDKSTNTKLPDKTDFIVDIYQGESTTNSASIHSNPIITYPPKTKSDLRISDDKTVRSRGPSEDRPRKSFNEHSEPYFTRPKGVQRIKEMDPMYLTLDPNNQPKPRSSDAADLKNFPKESFKMPVPIPIPVTIPTISSKRKPEDIATNDDIIKKGSILEQNLQDQEPQNQELQYQGPQDQELQGTINLKDTEIPPRLLRTKSTSGDTDEKPIESPKTATIILSNVEKPTAANEIEGQNLNETKSQSLNAIKTDETNIKDTEQLESLKIPVAIPVPFLLNTHFEGSEDMQQNIEPVLEKNESFAKTPPKSNILADAIPENFFTRGGFSDQENYTEIPVTLDPIMEKDIKRDTGGKKNTDVTEKPARETGVKEKATTATKYTEEYMERDSKEEEITDGIGKQLELNYTQEDKKRDSHGVENTDGIEKPAKTSEIKDKPTIPIKNTEEDIKRDSKGEEITDRIRKPLELKYTQEDKKRDSHGVENTNGIENPAKTSEIKDKTTIPTKNTEEDIKRDSKVEEITDGIRKPLELKYTQEDKKRDSYGVENTDGIEKPAKTSEIKDKTTISKKNTEDDIKRDSKGEEITDEIEKRMEQNDTQEDKKPDFEEENIKDAIKTPTELKDTTTIPTKYIDNEVKRGSEAEAIINGIVKPVNQEAINENDTENKAKTVAKYEEDISDIYGMLDMETQQIKGTLKEGDQKDSQIISPSQLKRSKSPDKYRDNIGHGDTDLGIHKNKKRSSLLSEPEYETDTEDKIKKPNNNKGYVDETTKPNIIAAPVIIDNTGRPSIFGPIKDVYRETDLVGATQIASELKIFGDDENLQSFVNEAEEYDPSTSRKKQAETIPSSDKRVILPGDTVLSSVQSASPFKSAMKKDTVSIDFGFHSYLNDKNERIVKTFDSAKAPKRLPSDSITVIKSQIRITSNEIRIPVDSEHDMSIQIKKVNANQRVSLSESGLVNIIDHDRAKQQRSPVQCSDVEPRSSEVKAEEKKDNINESVATADRFLDYYEQELVPLQLIIKNLRDEIDFLATQQTMFKDKLYCPNKSKLPRLVNSNKKCFGCVRK